ncbi:hypothetical protein SUDANB6_05226 [Streptomyces sp. enrichment culture]
MERSRDGCGKCLTGVLRRFADRALGRTTGRAASGGARRTGPRLLGLIGDCPAR